MDETEYERLIGAALRFVSYRPRSSKELRDFCDKTLKRHHTTAPLVVERVLTRLMELGYLDDRKFIEWWVGQRRSSKPKGTRLIRQELKAKGIAKEDIDEFFSYKEHVADDTQLARNAVAKKLSVWALLPAPKKRQKAYEFLLRRGFDFETASRVVDDIGQKE